MGSYYILTELYMQYRPDQLRMHQQMILVLYFVILWLLQKFATHVFWMPSLILG